MQAVALSFLMMFCIGKDPFMLLATGILYQQKGLSYSLWDSIWHELSMVVIASHRHTSPSSIEGTVIGLTIFVLTTKAPLTVKCLIRAI